MEVFHYTDKDGFNAVRSQRDWVFTAREQKGGKPYGAYFTDYAQDEPLLANKLRIPRSKIEYVFCFTDAGDLKPLAGGRGKHIFYSPVDYVVASPRQVRHGAVRQ